MEIFTESEVKILRYAAKSLQRKQEFDFRKLLNLNDNNDHVSYGQLREACSIADEQLFNCLNLAHAHFDCEASKWAIGGWHS